MIGDVFAGHDVAEINLSFCIYLHLKHVTVSEFNAEGQEDQRADHRKFRMLSERVLSCISLASIRFEILKPEFLKFRDT